MEPRKRHSVDRNLQRQEWEILYPIEKRCSRCLSLQPAAEFHKAKREKDGLKSYCRSCSSAECKASYGKNPEKHIKRVADWQKANPENKKRNAKNTYYSNHASRRARGKAAYESNKDRILEDSRNRYAEDAGFREMRLLHSLKYYRGNAEDRIEYQKRYRADNPEKASVWVNNRRIRKKNAVGECTPHEWAELLEYFNYSCAYCLRHEFDAGKMTIDHMTPLSRGGSNEPENLVPCCRSCNSSKNKKTVLEFLAYNAKRQAAA